MESQATAIHKVPVETMLYVAGNKTFNNDVLCRYLQDQTGLPCLSIHLSDLFYPKILEGPTSKLIFVDCAAMGSPKQCQLAALRHLYKDDPIQFICFNVAKAARLGHEAFQKGIKGIIDDQQPVDLYSRAAEAVLAGELWFPRRILEKIILANQASPQPTVKENSDLTRREEEILNMLGSGISNQDIAKQLCISPHTVKTHVYNIFKKINVANRFQAVRWLIDEQRKSEKRP